MKRILVDATFTVNLSQVPVRIDDNFDSKNDYKEELADLVMQIVEKRLVLLDVKGGRSGSDGCIEHVQCDGVENWTSE